MAEKWSQKYITNPFTSLMPTDIVAIARSGTSGAAQWGTLFTNLCSGQGSTLRFDVSGGTIKLKVTDNGTNNNTILGLDAGNGSMTGQYNTGYGSGALNDLTNGNGNSASGYLSLNGITSGQNNTAYGYLSLWQLKTGTFNIAIGSTAASNYTTNESFNINIGSSGIVGDSHTTRIGYINGTAPTQDACYIDGIAGKTVSGNPVVINSDGRLAESFIYSFSSRVDSGGPPIPNVTGDSTIYKIIYNDVFNQKGSWYNSNTGIATIPVDGTYMFNCAIAIEDIVSNNNQFYAFFTYNGNPLYPIVGMGSIFSIVDQFNSPNIFEVNGSLLWHFTAGEEIGVSIVASGSVTKNISLPGTSGELRNTFSGALICAH